MTELTPSETIRCDGWTSARQRDFAEMLAECGSVERSAVAVGMTRRSAYHLRHRRSGMAFRLAWDAAILLARARLSDDLMERALFGQEDVTVRDKEAGTVTRHRHDNRLAMSLLSRLDRMASFQSHDEDAQLARVVAQDFEPFLRLISAGAVTGDVADYFEERAALDLMGIVKAVAEEEAECSGNEQCELRPETAVKSEPAPILDATSGYRPVPHTPPPRFDPANKDHWRAAGVRS